MTSKDELRRIAREKGVIPYLVEKEYLQYMFLSALYGGGARFVLKGAACLKIAYGYERFARNLEFLSDLPPEEVKNEVLKALEQLSTLKIKGRVTSERLHGSGYSVWVEIEGPLFDKESKLANRLWLKVSFGSPMLNPREIKITPPYPGVEGFSITAMRGEEILAEKVVSLAVEKSPEAAFDVWSMMKRGIKLNESLAAGKASNAGQAFIRPTFPFCDEEKYSENLRTVLPSTKPYEQVMAELKPLLGAPEKKVEIKRPRREHGYLLMGLLFVGALFAVSYWVIQSGQENSYTVLYFTDPLNPLVYHPAEAAITVNFTVENQEGRALNFTYVVSLYEQNTDKVLKEVRGTVSLKDRESKKVSEKIGVPGAASGYSTVSVALYREGDNEAYRTIWHNKFSSQ